MTGIDNSDDVRDEIDLFFNAWRDHFPEHHVDGLFWLEKWFIGGGEYVALARDELDDLARAAYRAGYEAATKPSPN